MKDFQFAIKKLVVEPGGNGILDIQPDVSLFMDKKFVVVSGIALNKVKVTIPVGDTNINIADHSKYVSSYGSGTSATHIIEIPIPCNRIFVSVDNSSGSDKVHVQYYGGSA